MDTQTRKTSITKVDNRTRAAGRKGDEDNNQEGKRERKIRQTRAGSKGYRFHSSEFEILPLIPFPTTTISYKAFSKKSSYHDPLPERRLLPEQSPLQRHRSSNDTTTTFPLSITCLTLTAQRRPGASPFSPPQEIEPSNVRAAFLRRHATARWLHHPLETKQEWPSKAREISSAKQSFI